MKSHKTLDRIVKLSFVFIGIIIATLPCTAHATVHHSKHRAHKAARHSRAPVSSVAGYADLVIDGESGLILHATNAQRIRHPASLTKMMTLYITFQALETGRLRWDQRLPVSENASEQSPTKLGLRAGQSIRVEDAVLGLITESANDAAMVLAEGMAGSSERFAGWMTRQARAIGMKNTTFQNPNGLPDPDQVTSAADMVRLGYALIYHYPQYYTYFSTASFTYGGAIHRNHNHLMERYDGMDGIKTGYIRTSGFNLVASAVQNQHRLIASVFGGKSAPSRDNQMEQLLDESFRSASTMQRQARAPVVLAGQNDADANDVGEYLPLPAKVNAVFSPAANSNAPTPVAPTAVAPTAVAPRPQPVAAPAPAAALPPKTDQIAEALQTPALSAQAAQQPVAQAQAPQQPAPAVAPVVEAPLPEKAPEKTQEKNWGIQIGVYPDVATARFALKSLARHINKSAASKPTLQEVIVNKRHAFRARFVDMTEKTANTACAELIHKKRKCWLVPPTQ